MKLGRMMFNFRKGNDIGVAPNLHFIPPPYLKGRARYDTSVKKTQQVSTISLSLGINSVEILRMVLSP